MDNKRIEAISILFMHKIISNIYQINVTNIQTHTHIEDVMDESTLQTHTQTITIELSIIQIKSMLINNNNTINNNNNILIINNNNILINNLLKSVIGTLEISLIKLYNYTIINNNIVNEIIQLSLINTDCVNSGETGVLYTQTAMTTDMYILNNINNKNQINGAEGSFVSVCVSAYVCPYVCLFAYVLFLVYIFV